MTVALVLGGGGVTEIAWETGLLLGLVEAGVDLTGAELVIGTSAGSVVGAQVATGVPLAALYDRQVAPAAAERAPDLARLMEFLPGRAGPDGQAAQTAPPTPEVLAWIGSQARTANTRFTGAGRLEVIAARLPVQEWPERPLLVTAIDTEDGRFVTWDRSSGVPLTLAVASSCAVPWIYPPVTIRGRRYMDGGVRSPTNADLATGHDVVVIVAPTGGMSSALLEAEVADLRRAGSRVEVVVPDAAAVEAIGPNPLDPARRAASGRAGRAQAAGAAALLAASVGR